MPKPIRQIHVMIDAEFSQVSIRRGAKGTRLEHDLDVAIKTADEPMTRRQVASRLRSIAIELEREFDI